MILFFFLFVLPSRGQAPEGKEVYATWHAVGGDRGSSKYSSLDQINRSNVDELEIAWIYRTGDSSENSTIECNPIIVDGVLYATTPSVDLIALDAATGEEIWRFRPVADFEKGPSHQNGVNRGVAFWQSEDGSESRILYTHLDRLFAVDAGTGKSIPDFGEGGSVDLRKGLSRPLEQLTVESTSSGVVFEDLVIFGGRGNYHGIVRAYDVRSGALRWLFNVVPHPGEPGYETWAPDTWRTVEGASAWGGLTIDVENAMVFFGTGGPKPDFYGWLYPGQNLFANSVVALNARTGEYIWHFQEIKHDIWDLDLPAPPVLVTVNHDGEEIEAVAQVSKTANTFLLDRFTGESLFPLIEAPVPGSDIPIEQPWPAQRVPLRPQPFARQVMTKDDITDLSQEAYEDALERFMKTRSGWFVPISPRGTILYGIDGGAEWPGAAFDPETGYLYVAANNQPFHLVLEPVGESEGQGSILFGRYCTACHGSRDSEAGVMPGAPGLAGVTDKYDGQGLTEILTKGRNAMPTFSYLGEDAIAELVEYMYKAEEETEELDSDTPGEQIAGYRHLGYNRFKDIEGYPAVKPPWGVMTAIDLDTGEHVWQVPVGEFPELTARGIPPTGTVLIGGPIVTAGGLVFMAGSKDEKIRAFDKATGEILWEADLPFAGNANPSTYMIDGRQYVVIAAGGGGKNFAPSGDAYVAFVLPE